MCKEKVEEANKQQCQEHLIVNTGCTSDLQGRKMRSPGLFHGPIPYVLFRTRECKH